MIRMCKNMSKWEIILFWFALSRVHVWCEDDGSNQCLPPQCKLCMNVYFNNLSEIFVDVHVTKAFVLTSNVLFKNFDIMILRNSLHTCLLQIWDNFYTPNARWLAYCDLHILSVRSGRGAQLLSCSHLVDHTNIPLIFQMNCIGQRSFWGD